MLKIAIFYFDLARDVATAFFFYHISSNILDLIGIENRYKSVGELNFELLYVYLIVIVIIMTARILKAR